MNGKFYIKTYGCQMNVHESEKIAGMLEARNLQICDDPAEADILVFNTCCVRETAETKILGHLGRVKSQKKSGAILIVCGCMTQQKDVAKKVLSRCPFVDIAIGTFNMCHLNEYIDAFCANGKRICEVWDSDRSTTEPQSTHRSSGVNAWLNIMYGCNNFCSYCIVPYVRGRERSRSVDEILTDAESLIKAGYKQITLLGQNVNSYYYNGVGFTDLLKKLDFGIHYRLKFMTSHPKDFSIELAECIAQSKSLSHNLHLPVQSGSNRILELMNRKYTREQYLEKITAVKSIVPDIGLSSDIIVGFPTETEDDFLQTVDLVQRVEYNNLFTFIYSRRSGTPADLMPQLDYPTKQDRIKRLIDCQFSITKRLAEKTVGSISEVLVSEKSGNQCYGKNLSDAAVAFSAPNVCIGDFVNVKITSAKNANLLGVVE